MGQKDDCESGRKDFKGSKRWELEVGNMIRHMLCVTICILLVAQCCNGDSNEWPQLGHDGEHTFFSNRSVSSHLEITWQYHVPWQHPERGKYAFCETSSPAVVEGRVYLVDFLNLRCLDLDTGELLYEVPAYSLYPYTPTIVDEKIYLAAEENLFQCLDANNGTVVWEKDLPNLYFTNPLVREDTVYVTIDNFLFFGFESYYPCFDLVPQWRTLLALDRETGEELWHYSIPNDSAYIMRGVGFPILVDDTLFFYVTHYEDEESYHADQERSTLVCLDARTGELKWELEDILPHISTDLDGSLPFSIAYHDGRIYSGSVGNVICFDTETHELLWRYRLPSGWALVLVGNGVVVIRGWNSVYCLDAETGEELWKTPVKGRSMPAMTGEEIFIGSDDGNLYRIDIQSGRITQSYYLGGFVFSPIVAEGHILVGTSENTLYCLGPSVGLWKVIGVIGIAAVAVLIILLLLRKAGYGRP